VTSPIYSWTGFYAGANAGWHWGKDSITTTTEPFGGFGVKGASGIDSASPGTVTPSGAAAGGQVGFNWQLYHTLIGIEADADWLGGSASRTVGPGIPNSNAAHTLLNSADTMLNSTKATFLATVRPRVGVVFDNSLLYVTGGLAIVTLKTTDTMGHLGNTVFTTASSTVTRATWTIGAGWEFAFLPNWTAKIEYLYLRVRPINTIIPSSPGGFPDDILVVHKYEDNIIRAGLNWRFGYVPVVTTY
jgi:outer membrane immunogenic protein